MLAPGKKQEPISKITREKKAKGMTQGVEHLPSKCEALSPHPSTTKKILKDPYDNMDQC
jgi:hypothetical protein